MMLFYDYINLNFRNIGFEIQMILKIKPNKQIINFNKSYS